MRRVPGLVIMLGLLAWSSNVSAAPVTWNVAGSFDAASGGGNLSGFFVWDSDTLALSDWSITVAGGTAAAPPFASDPTAFSATTYDPSTSIACGLPAGPPNGLCTGTANTLYSIVVSQVFNPPGPCAGGECV